MLDAQPNAFMDESKLDDDDAFSRPLLDEELGDTQGLANIQRYRFNRHSLSLVVLYIFALYGVFDSSKRGFTWLRHHIPATGNPPCYCGTTDTQAIAMGCEYDHLAVDWLPPRCIDTSLTQAFDDAGPNGSWPYYILSTDSRSFIPLGASDDVDMFARQGTEYFATREWHIQHCLFIWRKQFRAGKGNSVEIEPWNDREEHIDHCTEYILEAVREKEDLDEIETWIPGVDRHVRE